MYNNEDRIFKLKGETEEKKFSTVSTEEKIEEANMEEVIEKEEAKAESTVKKITVCSNCGAPLKENQLFCPECGSSTNKDVKKKCKYCGADIAPGHTFCASCGNKVADKSDLNKMLKKIDVKKYGKIAVVAIVVVAILVGGIFVAKKLLKKDFNDRYGDLASYAWCKIGSDGSYIKIDTNPFDVDEDDMGTKEYTYLKEASSHLEEILSDLGFSSAVYEEMGHTTWSMGKQTEETKKYKVSWTYHPNKGLEVMIEEK